LAPSSPHYRNIDVGRYLLILSTVVVLLLLPVEYRAGAQQPHPHAILQLIWEASQGTPSHHIRAAMHPCALETAARQARLLDTSDHAAAVGHAGRYQPDVADTADSTRMSSTLLALALMPWLACLVRLLSPSDKPWRRSGTMVDGVTHSPEPPPPKTLLSPLLG
jgi:hypothetical protein